jgi:hypothetical protein
MIKRHLKVTVTNEELKQFWNHKINPITGFKTNASDKYTPGEKVESKFIREMKEKFNKE